MGSLIKNLLFIIVWVAILLIAGSTFYNTATVPAASKIDNLFVAAIVKYSPYIITVPICIAMIISQTKVILKSFRYE